MVLLAASVASLALWLSLDAGAGGSSVAWVNSIRIFASQLGITFLVAAAAVFVLLSFQFEQRGSSDAEAEKQIGGWLPFLALSLVVLPLVALAVASPLVSFWGDALRAMDTLGVWKEAKKALGSQFGGLLLAPLLAVALPALLEFAPLVSYLASSAVLLVLFSLRTRRFPGAFLAWVLVHLACVLGSFYTIDLLANLTPALLNELNGEKSQEVAVFAAWIRRHDEMAEPTAIRLAWLLLGYLVWAPALLVSQRAKRTFTVEASVPSLESIHARLAERPFFQAAPSAAPGAGAWPERPQLADGLQHSAYIVQSILSLKSFLANREHKISAPAHDPGEKVVFYCRATLGVFSMGFPLRMVATAGEKALFLITKRRTSLTSLAYTVSVPSTQEPLGVVVRTDFAGTLWLLRDGHGRQIGWVARVAHGRELQRYQAHIEEAPVCQFVWREQLLGADQVEITFAQESDRTLDKRALRKNL